MIVNRFPAALSATGFALALALGPAEANTNFEQIPISTDGHPDDILLTVYVLLAWCVANLLLSRIVTFDFRITEATISMVIIFLSYLHETAMQH